MTDATKRNASTARRSRRDRHHYLAGERAGMLAGLKEAAAIATDQADSADEMRTAARDESDRLGRLVHSAEAAEGRLIAKLIRARMSEIEGEAP